MTSQGNFFKRSVQVRNVRYFTGKVHGLFQEDDGLHMMSNVFGVNSGAEANVVVKNVKL